MTFNTLRRALIWLSIIGCAAFLVARATQYTQPAAAAGGNPLTLNVKAPELVGKTWFNTVGDKPLTLAGRKGKVTIVHFWTFGCINCRNNLPIYNRWDEKYGKQGVEIIGVHTPELANERDPKNVAREVKKLNIEYPVLFDGDNRNWQNWEQKYWPTVYLLDKNGKVRYAWIGELNSGGQNGEAKMSNLIEQLQREKAPGEKMAQSAGTTAGEKIVPVVLSDAEWKKRLTPVQYDILRHEGTEAPGTGVLLNEHEKGIFRCAGCGLDVFKSETKFESGTGWPSFWQPIKGHVVEKTDTTLGMSRTEVECARCGGHLGHVFDDGPQPTGLRYCMNSGAMTFQKQ